MYYNIEMTVEIHGHGYEIYQYDGDCFNYGSVRLYDIEYYNWHELETAYKDIIRQDYKYYDVDNVTIDVYKSDTDILQEHKQLMVEDLL